MITGMSEAVSGPDFDEMSWHDNIVYGLQFEIGDASAGDWLPAGTPR